MSDQFERDPRRKQELEGRPIADKIYKDIFFDGIVIERDERQEGKILDIQHAIDVKIKLPNGLILNGQEKFLSETFAKFRSLTIEYKQNQFTGEGGDWYKLASQFYFCGYFNKERTWFEPFVMVDWARVVIETHLGRIVWLDNTNNDGRARASFRYCIMDALPRNCIIASSLKN